MNKITPENQPARNTLVSQKYSSIANNIQIFTKPCHYKNNESYEYIHQVKDGLF